jgi:hypothetical protein
MKLRIQLEGRAYELDVGTFNSRRNGASRPRTTEFQPPPSVTRTRPPQKLPEDSVCRSPVAGRVVAVFGVKGKVVRRNEPVVLIEAMKMEIPIGPAGRRHRQGNSRLGGRSDRHPTGPLRTIVKSNPSDDACGRRGRQGAIR